ncbi:hypothetical protein D3C80_2068130 [compost metagenome]
MLRISHRVDNGAAQIRTVLLGKLPSTLRTALLGTLGTLLSRDDCKATVDIRTGATLDITFSQ